MRIALKWFEVQKNKTYKHVWFLQSNPKFLPHWQGDKEHDELYEPNIGHDSKKDF
jgi:hypothetical protein